jgi:hypothetical protein
MTVLGDHGSVAPCGLLVKSLALPNGLISQIKLPSIVWTWLKYFAYDRGS